MARRRRPRHNPLAKLKPYRRRLEVDMVRRLLRAQGEIKGRIALAAAKASIAGSAREREALFREIEERYGELANGIDAQLKEMAGKVGQAAHEGAVASIGRKRKSRLVKYDPERTERYFQMIHPMNGKNIAAVFTDQMSQRLINTLRSSYVDVFRQGVVEGMTANELQKALRDRWDKLAGNGNNFRFVDSRGRRWENARYFQMLVRTNAQRVERESSIDTFAREGLVLMRISDDGDADCDICAAWEGRIVQTVGESDKYPTYEEAVAAGVFHPNCTHTLEYVDELLEKDDIERQAELGKPDDTDDVEEMQAQKDEIDEGRYIDKGMSRMEAQRAVTADRLEKSIRGGIFSEEAARAARMLSPEELDRIRASGIPMFEKARNNEQVGTKRHGRILTPREATAQDILKLLGVDRDGGGKAQAVPQEISPAKLAATRAQAVKDNLVKRGFSAAVVDEAAKTPASVWERIEPPKVKVSAGRDKYSAFYRPTEQSVYMPLDANTWSGHPLAWHHELGHHIDEMLGWVQWQGKDKGYVVAEALTKALESDTTAWQAQAERVMGKNWRSALKGKNQRWAANVAYAKEVGVADYVNAGLSDQHRVKGLLDTIQGASKGRYGWGHKKDYMKQIGEKEVVAHLYRAAVKGWQEYEVAFPATMRYIKGEVGL